jgi:hypothetical protein
MSQNIKTWDKKHRSELLFPNLSSLDKEVVYEKLNKFKCPDKKIVTLANLAKLIYVVLKKEI